MSKYWLNFLAKLYVPILVVIVFQFTVNNIEMPVMAVVISVYLIFCAILTFIYYKDLTPFLKFIVFVAMSMVVVLITISFYKFNTPFVYPNVFQKPLLFTTISAGFIFSKKTNVLTRSYMLKWIYTILLIKVAISFLFGVGSDGFKWGSDGRLVYAPEAMLLLIPLILYYIDYATGKSKIYPFAFILGCIFIAQHRTVWMCALVAIILLIFKYQFTVKRLVPKTIILAALVIMVLADQVFDPKFLKTFNTQVEDIMNYKEQGTGSWRYEQSQFFLAYIAQRPWLGWNFDGYEIGEFVEDQPWEEKGTHIHSGYIEPLFYFGIIGLIFYWLSFLVLGLKYFRRRDEYVLFAIFAFCMFTYGASYQIPLAGWGICGMGLYYLTDPSAQPVQDEEEEEESDEVMEIQPVFGAN